MSSCLGIGNLSRHWILSDSSPAVALWKQDRVSWSIICRHTTSRKPSAGQSISAIPRSRSYPRCGHGSTMRGISMLVKLETTDYLIYAKLNKTERVTHLASQNRIHLRTCYAILYEIEQRGDFHVTWGLADDGYIDTVRITRRG